MDIALLGGTGDIGEGLALRWGRDADHRLLIGSRKADRAVAAAEEYAGTITDHGATATVEGADNEAAAAAADVVLCCVPAYHLVDTIEAVGDSLDPGDVLVSPAVGMKRDEAGFHYNRPGAGSVTELAARAAPEAVPVVGAFHHLSAERLADLSVEIDEDALLVGDDEAAVETVAELAEDVTGLRALSAGGLANAAEVESLTPLLINVARNNERLHHIGVTFD